jgi:hypothetical protein
MFEGFLVVFWGAAGTTHEYKMLCHRFGSHEIKRFPKYKLYVVKMYFVIGTTHISKRNLVTQIRLAVPNRGPMPQTHIAGLLAYISTAP